MKIKQNPNKHETSKISFLLIVKITKIIKTSLYNMIGNYLLYVYIHVWNAEFLLRDRSVL